MGVGMLVLVWVARYLGPEQFGLLNFALAFTGLFGAIATLGLQGIVVRDIVRHPEEARLTLGTAAMLQLVAGFLSFLLILGAIAYLRPDDALARTIVTILGAMMLLKASEIAVYWFESQVQSKYTVWVQNGVFLVFAAVKVGLIVHEAPLTSFVWAMLVEAVAVAFFLLLVMSKRGNSLMKLRFNRVRGTSLLRDSWPLILSGIAITIYMKIDQIMLGQMIDDEAVGIYSAATRISEIWYFIPGAIVASTFPTILEAKKINKTLYEKKIISLLRLLIILAIVISVVFSIASNKIVELLFGDGYLESANILIIHIWTGVFVSIGLVAGNWFLAEGRQLHILQITILAAIMNTILNAFLIPSFGVIGAAFSTLFSYGVSNLVWPVMFKQTRPFIKLLIQSTGFKRMQKYEK